MRKPLPTTSTPSRRSGASVRPSSTSAAGSIDGSETCNTGMSAAGYIAASGCVVRSRPKPQMLLFEFGVLGLELFSLRLQLRRQMPPKR